MLKLIFLMLTLTLAGCATHMSQQQCVASNWRFEGVKDGTAGIPPRDLASTMQDCSQYGVTVNTADYHAGWQQGAKQFCTPDENVGMADGMAGKPANDITSRATICAVGGMQLNLSAYNAGRQKGLKTFCTYQNGVNVARQGQSLPDVCAANSSNQFNAGWNSGKNQFCDQPQTGFALGKDTKPYPEMCNPAIYIAFKSEYDRGFVIGDRINALKSQISDLDDKISWRQTFEGWGKNKSESEKESERETNRMIREKQNLDNQLLSLQVIN
jgi:hypothetical protein